MKKRLRLAVAIVAALMGVTGRKLFADEEAIETICRHNMTHSSHIAGNCSLMKKRLRQISCNTHQFSLFGSRKLFADEEAIETLFPLDRPVVIVNTPETVR